MKNVNAIVFQQKNTKLYYFAMDARELEALCYVEAATSSNQKGLQRVTEESRLRDISEYLKTSGSSLLPNNIIVNLTSNVLVKENSDGTAVISFPTDAGDYAFVVDGQHRLFSFRDEYRKIPDNEYFNLPVVALHNATDELVGQTFVSINFNQKPVNRDLLTQMKAILGLLETDTEKATIDLIHALNDDAHSPLHNRILKFPKEQNKWVKTNQLAPVVKALLASGGRLYGSNAAERKTILMAYLQAVAETFPDAWADTKKSKYALLLPTSLQIMISLLPDVMTRCDFYESFSYTTATFKKQLEPLSSLALLGDWAKTSVEEALSVKPKREAFLGELRQALRLKSPTP
jgi:DGQHR domain-containing protein